MGFLSESAAKKVLKDFGIPVVKEKKAKTLSDVIKCAAAIGYPVVLKAVSSVSHKTEFGGIEIDLRHEKDVAEAHVKIRKSAKNHGVELSGFLVQKYEKGYEMILGGKIDPQFGPTVLFGEGGIFIEIIGDVSVRVCPLSLKDALGMIDEVRFSKVFKGFRGAPPIDKKIVAGMILKVSNMMETGKYKELDINPLLVSHEGCKAVDFRILL